MEGRAGWGRDWVELGRVATGGAGGRGGGWQEPYGGR